MVPFYLRILAGLDYEHLLSGGRGGGEEGFRGASKQGGKDRRRACTLQFPFNPVLTLSHFSREESLLAGLSLGKRCDQLEMIFELTSLKDLSTLIPVLSISVDSVNTASIRLIATTRPSNMFHPLFT